MFHFLLVIDFNLYLFLAKYKIQPVLVIWQNVWNLKIKATVGCFFSEQIKTIYSPFTLPTSPIVPTIMIGTETSWTNLLCRDLFNISSKAQRDTAEQGDWSLKIATCQRGVGEKKCSLKLHCSTALDVASLCLWVPSLLMLLCAVQSRRCRDTLPFGQHYIVA